MPALAADVPPTMLALVDLAHRCTEETARYRRGQPRDDRFGFELFRRAIVHDDQGCWAALHEIYGERVQTWCRVARKDQTTDVDELSALCWERFWRAFRLERLAEAEGLGSILSYLKACAWSAVADQARIHTRHLSLDEPIGSPEDGGWTRGDVLADRGPTPAEAVTDAESVAELRKIVYACARTSAEATLIYLSFEVGLKAREVYARRPDLFRSIAAVYATTRNIHDRLQRAPALRHWLDSRTLTGTRSSSCATSWPRGVSGGESFSATLQARPPRLTSR